MERNPNDVFARIVEDNSLDESNLNDLLKYGMNNLPDDENRPNENLAGFFFCISDREGLSAQIRDLVTDAYVYCKNSADFPVPSGKTELAERYKTTKLSGLGDSPESS